MLTQELKPGERMLLELVCYEDREGRTKVTVDLLEKREATPSPKRRGKRLIANMPPMQ